MEDEVIDIDDEPIESEKPPIPKHIDSVVQEEENDGDLAEDTEQLIEGEDTEQILEDEIKQNSSSETAKDDELTEQEDIIESDDEKPLVVTIEKGEQISLSELIRSLVKKETRPHILLILAVAIPLHVLASIEGLILPISIAYLSISISYILIAYLTRFKTVKKIVSISSNLDEQLELSFAKRSLNSLKILLTPIILSSALAALMLISFSEGNRLQSVGDILPELLGSLFLIWAIGQARSFRGSTNAFLDGRYDTREIKKNNSIIISFVGTISILILTGSVLLYLFRGFHNGFDFTLLSLLINDWIFYVFLATISIILILTTKPLIESADDRLFRKKSFVWVTLCSLFIVWHGLTIYRKLIITDSAGFGSLIEEVILMLLTIVMAIWSLTSSQAKSDFPLVTKDNALFVGISFGYAYAGSVAMLTSALEGINMVIAAGHGIAVLSLLVLQRTTIKSRVDKHHSSERIQNLLKIEGSDEKLS